MRVCVIIIFYKLQFFSGSYDRRKSSIFELKIISGYGTGSGSGPKPFNQLNPSPFELKTVSGYGTENGSGPKSGSVPKRKRIWEKIIPTIYGYQEQSVYLNMFSIIVRRRQGSINLFNLQPFPGILKQLGSEEKPGFRLKKTKEIFRALLNCFTFNHRMMEEADESVLLELTEHQRPDPPAAEEPPTIVLDDDETLLDVDEEMEDEEDDEIKLLERAIGDRPAPTGDDVPAQACPDIPAIPAAAVPPPSPHPAASEKEKVNDYDSESNSTRNSENLVTRIYGFY
jgi:hypothetical protein